ncbi:MAG: hypothetical protein IAE95_06610 [Chitinophagaceae bacterium]|nr:hypothetical protein [Chitinophagaceae bacterium]
MLSERHKLLEKLLTTNHLNVSERRCLDSSPTFSELLEVAERYFQNGIFLPAVIIKWDDKKVCYEGYSLEKVDQSYILHFQIAGASMNLYANEKELYSNLKDALHAFLYNEHHFNINGIPILDK